MKKKRKRRRNWVIEVISKIEKNFFFLPDIKKFLKEEGVKKEELEAYLLIELNYLIELQGSIHVDIAAAARILVAMLPGKKIAEELESILGYQKLEEACEDNEKINKLGDRAIMGFAFELAFRIPKNELRKKKELLKTAHQSRYQGIGELAGMLLLYIKA